MTILFVIIQSQTAIKTPELLKHSVCLLKVMFFGGFFRKKVVYHFKGWQKSWK